MSCKANEREVSQTEMRCQRPDGHMKETDFLFFLRRFNNPVQSHWSIAWFRKSMNPLGWPDTLIRYSLRWLIAVRGQETHMKVQCDVTCTWVAQFSLFLIQYTPHFPYFLFDPLKTMLHSTWVVEHNRC